MNDKVIDILKDRPIVIPRYLFKNYKKLNITEEEFIILMYMLDMGDRIVYNPDVFVKDLSIDKYKAMEIINYLCEKNIVSIKTEKNKYNKMEEYIYFDLLYDKILNLSINDSDRDVNDNVDVSYLFNTFENEFGRTISPMEYELIKRWISDKVPQELILEALKEAVFNNVCSMRYIERILDDWHRKGFKTVSDVNRDRNNYKQNKKRDIEVYDYNWLDDE